MQAKLTCLEDLAKLDRGTPDRMVREVLQLILADLVDRPALDALRTLTLKVNFKPVSAVEGHLHEIITEVEVSAKIPVKRSPAYSMKPADKGFRYNDLSPDNADQMTLDDVPTGKDKQNNV
jgi:hypothetical protein